MLVVIAKPREAAFKADIKNTLKELQGLVGGHIEVVKLGPPLIKNRFSIRYLVEKIGVKIDNVLAIVNEEGKLQGLPVNLYHTYDDVLVGTIVLLQDVGEDFAGLEDAQADLLITIMNKYRPMPHYEL